MKIKPAFTLAEIMMFFVVVAILLSILFVTIKPTKNFEDKNASYKYSTVYDALNLAVFQLVSEDDTNPFNAPNPPESFQKLCSGLAEYINTEESPDCSSVLADNAAFMQGSSYYDFKLSKPNFTALNGVKFYISKLITDNTSPATDRSYYKDEDPDFVLKFFMVYADLNGKDTADRPHGIIAQNKRKHPDVFAFAVIPTGDAIPVGVAEYDIRYLPVRIAYKENHNKFYTASSYSLREAKHIAWGMYSTVSNTDKSNDFIKTVPFTYNDHIKKIIKKQEPRTLLYSFNNDGTYPEIYNDSMLSQCIPPQGSALTVYDMCTFAVHLK